MLEYESGVYVYAELDGGVLVYGVWFRETGRPLFVGSVGDGVLGPLEEDAVV